MRTALKLELHRQGSLATVLFFVLMVWGLELWVQMGPLRNPDFQNAWIVGFGLSSGLRVSESARGGPKCAWLGSKPGQTDHGRKAGFRTHTELLEP